MQLQTFIKRPILSSVVSVLILLVGILGLMSLPIERYPSIAPPTVEISSYFTGANSETVLKTAIVPLEDAIHGVENMLYMYSTASNSGEINVRVVFKQGTNPDIDAVNVQNRVEKAKSVLPQEVKTYGITVEKVENSILQLFSVYSPNDAYDYAFLSNYASINIKPRILNVSGVGKFQMLGSEYSMRVWLDPYAMTQHNLVPSDVINVLASQNIEAATGTIGENSNEQYQYAMRYTGRLKSEEEFNNIIIRSEQDGSILRLKDIAKIELGTEFYNMTGYNNGHPGVMCIVYQSTGSNATLVNNQIAEALEQIRKEAPSGVDVGVLMSTNDFLYAAIDQVVETLRDAIILVVLIVLLFLKDFKSTLIPFISIIVSLIGTFAFMTIAGFSINLLTLFALVLVIGTVVDDSIVVVEAVHAQFDAGETSPYKATKNAIKGVAKAVLTSSMVFMAVFIPVSFLGGTSGIFYQQFGLTMAVAVGISALNSLTTVPALCALMLKPIKQIKEGEKGTFQQRYARGFDNFFEKFTTKYKNGLSKVISVKPVIWIISLGSLALLTILMDIMPSGLVPLEDQGMFIVEVNTPPGSSLYRTDNISKEYAIKAQQIPGVEMVSQSGGYGFIAGANSSASTIILRLAPWEERSGESSFFGLYRKLTALGEEFPEANFTVFTLPMIPGYGTNSGIDMYVQDRRGGTIQELYDVTKQMIDDLRPLGVEGFMAFNMEFPQWQVTVDVAKCMRFGLTPKDVLSTLGTYYGGYYASDINLYSKVYKVMVMGNPETRRTELSLNKTYVRTSSGQMAPLSNFVSISRTFGPEVIKTFNKFTAINVSASSTFGSGEGMRIINEYAQTRLPEGYTVDYAGMSREQDSQGSLGIVLLLCMFIIYLLLAALYESVFIPFAVLLAVPLGLAGSYGISYLFGLDNNIYLQTGVIMLIGLLAKTSILITEYAVERHEQGMSIREAAIDAAGARIRAILMTAGAMIIGLLPLVASLGGVGGVGNFSLGLGTVTGMIVGTVGLLYITPTLYTTFQALQDKFKKQNEDDEDDED